MGGRAAAALAAAAIVLAVGGIARELTGWGAQPPVPVTVKAAAAVENREDSPSSQYEMLVEGDGTPALTEAVTPGWQGVAVELRGLAYDVPPDWEVGPPGLARGFEAPDPSAPFGYTPVIGVRGVAEFGQRDPGCADDCPPSPASAGTSSVSPAPGQPLDTAETATYLAGEWASIAYRTAAGEATFTVPPAQPFDANGLQGHQVTVDVAVAPQQCYPRTAQVRVVSVPTPDRTEAFNLVIYADSTGATAPAPGDLDTILSSLRSMAAPVRGS